MSDATAFPFDRCRTLRQGGIKRHDQKTCEREKRAHHESKAKFLPLAELSPRTVLSSTKDGNQQEGKSQKKSGTLGKRLLAIPNPRRLRYPPIAQPRRIGMTTKNLRSLGKLLNFYVVTTAVIVTK